MPRPRSAGFVFARRCLSRGVRMDRVLWVLLFSAGLCSSAAAQEPNEILKAEGDSVTFQAVYSGRRDEITWKIGPDKLVELDGKRTHFYRLSDRASASFYGGFLTIRDLVASDSGDYSGNILNEGEYHETKFILKVTPSKPSINCTFLDNKLVLRCNSSSKGATYELRNSSHVLSSGPAVNVSMDGLNVSDSYVCIVNNSHAKISSNLTVCEPPAAGSGNLAAILVPVCLILAAAVTVLILCRKNLSRFQCWKPDAGKPDAGKPDAGKPDAGGPPVNAAEIKPLNSVDARPDASTNAEGFSKNIKPDQDNKRVQEDPDL